MTPEKMKLTNSVNPLQFGNYLCVFQGCVRAVTHSFYQWVTDGTSHWSALWRSKDMYVEMLICPPPFRLCGMFFYRGRRAIPYSNVLRSDGPLLWMIIVCVPEQTASHDWSGLRPLDILGFFIIRSEVLTNRDSQPKVWFGWSCHHKV